MERRNSPERLVFFSDAVVAIALTLLVLPLAESVPELYAGHHPASDVIKENSWQITSFVISFLVIGLQWLAHHRLFSQVKATTPLMVRLNFVWLFSVVVLPLPSELTGAYGRDHFAVLFYIGTLLVNALALSGMTVIVHRDDELVHDPGGITARRLEDSLGTVAAMAAAFVIALVFPAVQLYALLLLLVPSRIAWLRHRNENR